MCVVSFPMSPHIYWHYSMCACCVPNVDDDDDDDPLQVVKQGLSASSLLDRGVQLMGESNRYSSWAVLELSSLLFSSQAYEPCCVSIASLARHTHHWTSGPWTTLMRTPRRTTGAWSSPWPRPGPPPLWRWKAPSTWCWRHWWQSLLTGVDNSLNFCFDDFCFWSPCSYSSPPSVRNVATSFYFFRFSYLLLKNFKEKWNSNISDRLTWGLFLFFRILYFSPSSWKRNWLFFF